MISSSAHTAEVAIAASLDELSAHFAVRRRVFVEQQGLFEGSDRDAYDDLADTLHVVALVDGEVVGTVRLYPLGDGLFKGDRLAVLPDARVHRLGGELVQFAVRTGGALGGSRMVAQVQVPNVRFFERLGWVRDGEAARYHGVMHQPMAIALRRPGQ
ncbi:GNAT family N-acetyltransferase [Solirubrobacter ginsenosidimutans]|uniref:GNAT family N-acetyltransferase n=1 Tax=Solirubrobacter ginsenosidimutans TaxID=490573 RepID=A0A9X3RYI4_9ACTN|nr:MSMEG_0567/Sll0786 family nitrogen starvation N-acetyltransferase [Solirubrobacter ginsenosidimutans]MDA0159675.1 GNAT family N-acetyltransferase [Solirubrobacter ginsenosidimutans]